MKYHYSNTATGIVRDSHPVPLPPFFRRHLLNLLWIWIYVKTPAFPVLENGVHTYKCIIFNIQFLCGHKCRSQMDVLLFGSRIHSLQLRSNLLLDFFQSEPLPDLLVFLLKTELPLHAGPRLIQKPAAAYSKPIRSLFAAYSVVPFGMLAIYSPLTAGT